MVLSARFQRLPANHVASNSVRIHITILAFFLISATFFVDHFVVGCIWLIPLAYFSTPALTHTQYCMRYYKVALAGMSTIRVKSIVSTNTNTFVTIPFAVYYIQQHSFFSRSAINKFNRMIVVEKMAKLL